MTESKTSQSNFIIKELSTIEEMLEAYDLIKQRYQISIKDYQKFLSEMIEKNHFKMIAIYQNQSDQKSDNQQKKISKKIVGISGFHISFMFYCHRFIQLSSFIVDENYRNLGIGKMILAKAEEIAKNNDCQKIVLDSFTANKKSHHLYFRENFKISAFHFVKEIS